ncbi:rRNA maturation RNase YbeY [Spongiimicrobium salis]|uniref:rRNA maturation RNase YbeY n=1 Tax=Spongiimicrobium salis TaxID=1667022 RepID=UPI00374DF1D9
MIEFHFEGKFQLEHKNYYSDWISRILSSELFELGELCYIFCDDDYLHQINSKYLKHDTYTDIITFDYTNGNCVGGDVFISVERVRENAIDFDVDFTEELKRVMAHGVLHLMGYKDKSEGERREMRKKENEKIELFHVEQ